MSNWEERIRDFYSVFRGVYCADKKIRMRDAVSVALSMPAKRFYVSAERAVNVMCEIKNGRFDPSKMRSQKVAMFMEIWNRYLELHSQNPDRFMVDIVYDIVYSPAPKFYMTTDTAICCLSKYTRLLRCRRKY